MDLALRGKVALVGGSSRGLGYACARRLAEEGASVVLCARTKERVERAAEEIRTTTGAEILAVVADLGASDGPENFVRSALERFGHVDILVHNTGGPPPVYGVPYPGKERIEGVYTGDVVPCSEVMDEPPLKFWFVGFGNSSLDFELLVWIAGPLLRKQVLSDLNLRHRPDFPAARCHHSFPTAGSPSAFRGIQGETGGHIEIFQKKRRPITNWPIGSCPLHRRLSRAR